MQERSWRDARILVVDDEQMNIDILRRILEPEGYANIISTTDPRRTLDLYHEHNPDLILLDLKMPHLEGHEVLSQLKEVVPPETYLPILVLTSDGSSEAKRRALSGGARDFLTKPLSPMEVRLRIRNLLETRFLHLALQDQNQVLEQRVRLRTSELMRRTTELENARIEILERLARAAEFRDDETGFHTQRVGRTASQLGAALGLPADEVEIIRRAAPLHDIGKIGIPDAVLLKDGRLDPDEIEVMKTHTLIGAEILSGSGVPLLVVGREIALSHHEHWDGSGYPHGIARSEIPLSGRAVAVADVFDALTHPRPYKPAWPADEALNEIVREAGRQFDPEIVRAFASLYQEKRLAGPVAV
jgi:putative two-component system response regulator